MKRSRAAAFAAAIIAVTALLSLAGCGGGGKTNQDLSSPWYGQLYGIAIEPHNQETNIALDSAIHVYWPDPNYPPPASFTVRLEKEQNPNDWGVIHTIQDNNNSNPTGGSWWFQPESNFSPNTWYRIIVTDDRGRTATVYFESTNSVLAAASPTRSADSTAPTAIGKIYRPAGAENAQPLTGEGLDQQVITTRK